MAKNEPIEKLKGMQKNLLILAIVALEITCFWLLLLHFNNYWVCTRILFCPISVLLCIVLSDVSLSGSTLFYRTVSSLGVITLELYLVHERALYWIHVIIGKIIPYGMVESVISNIIGALVSVIIANFTSRFIRNIHIRRY